MKNSDDLLFKSDCDCNSCRPSFIVRREVKRNGGIRMTYYVPKLVPHVLRQHEKR